MQFILFAVILLIAQVVEGKEASFFRKQPKVQDPIRGTRTGQRYEHMPERNVHPMMHERAVKFARENSVKYDRFSRKEYERNYATKYNELMEGNDISMDSIESQDGFKINNIAADYAREQAAKDMATAERFSRKAYEAAFEQNYNEFLKNHPPQFKH